jgi:aquaporin Z
MAFNTKRTSWSTATSAEVVSAQQKYAAEFIGTFTLVLFGCGAAVLSAWSGIGIVGIALVFGLTIAALVYAIGNISGCHINPAVSIAMLVAGKIKVADAAGYIVAQFFGGIVAAGLLLALLQGLPSYSISVNGLGANGFDSLSPIAQVTADNAGFGLVAVFAVEVVLTFFFLLVILGATSKNASPGFAGVAIGSSLTFIHLFAITIDGTSVNPARSFGPALFVGGLALEQVWVFIAAPIAGGVLAAVVWRFVFKED